MPLFAVGVTRLSGGSGTALADHIDNRYVNDYRYEGAIMTTIRPTPAAPTGRSTR
jgi:hypothetical protein